MQERTYMSNIELTRLTFLMDPPIVLCNFEITVQTKFLPKFLGGYAVIGSDGDLSLSQE